MVAFSPRPKAISFDCYGTLIDWDRGMLAAVTQILVRHGHMNISPDEFLAAYDRIEHRMEQERPLRSFKTIAALALGETLQALRVPYAAEDASLLVASIRAMRPFPEVSAVLETLGRRYTLAIISNADDDVIAENVRSLGAPIDCVITAQQAKAYKPSHAIFNYAYQVLGVRSEEVVHVAASKNLDVRACRELGVRCIWINRRGDVADPRFPPDHVLTDLCDVPNLLSPDESRRI